MCNDPTEPDFNSPENMSSEAEEEASSGTNAADTSSRHLSNCTQLTSYARAVVDQAARLTDGTL